MTALAGAILRDNRPRTLTCYDLWTDVIFDTRASPSATEGNRTYWWGLPQGARWVRLRIGVNQGVIPLVAVAFSGNGSALGFGGNISPTIPGSLRPVINNEAIGGALDVGGGVSLISQDHTTGIPVQLVTGWTTEVGAGGNDDETTVDAETVVIEHRGPIPADATGVAISAVTNTVNGGFDDAVILSCGVELWPADLPPRW